MGDDGQSQGNEEQLARAGAQLLDRSLLARRRFHSQSRLIPGSPDAVVPLLRQKMEVTGGVLQCGGLPVVLVALLDPR